MTNLRPNIIFVFFFVATFLQCVLGQKEGPEELKWPVMNECRQPEIPLVNLSSSSFNTYIGMYQFKDAQGDYKYKLYLMNNKVNIQIYEGNSTFEGLPIKILQTTLESEINYLVWVEKRKFTVIPLNSPVQNYTIGIDDGFNGMEEPGRAFLLGHYLITGNNEAYNLSDVINPDRKGPIKHLSFWNVTLDGYEYPLANLSWTMNVIEAQCFSGSKTYYCAQNLFGTKFSDSLLVSFEEGKEIVQRIGGSASLYVRHGQDIGLNKNKRYYYFVSEEEKDNQTGAKIGEKHYYIPQNFLPNQEMTKIGAINVMMFPLIEIDDDFVKDYVDPKITKKPTQEPTTATEETTLVTVSGQTTPVPPVTVSGQTIPVSPVSGKIIPGPVTVPGKITPDPVPVPEKGKWPYYYPEEMSANFGNKYDILTTQQMFAWASFVLITIFKL